MPTITWLHLSDLHFKADALTKWDQDIVLRSLLEDVVRREEEDGLKPDFIVVSGDIAHSGAPEEYALASAFFDDLLKTTGLDKDRLFVVPGNHDVNWKWISRGAKSIAESLVDRETAAEVLQSADDRRLLLRRLDNYAAFVHGYFEGWLNFDDERYYYARRIHELGVAVLGLNSAWVAHGGESDRNKLVLGERQARAALDLVKGVPLRLAVMHHPFDWLSDFDRQDCESLLTKGCQFVLHGHLHRTGLTLTKTPDAEAMVLAAGSCFETRRSHNAYNWVQLDLDAGKGSAHLRMYSDNRGGFWTKDVLSYQNAPDGVFEFKLPRAAGTKKRKTSKKRTPPAVPTEHLQPTRENYLRYVVDRYRYLELRGMGVSDRVPLQLPLVEMYVPLKARVDLPAGEAWDRVRVAGRPVSEEEAEAMGRRLSEPQSLLELMQQHDGLIVLGDPGAGKTTFLKYLALRLAMGEGNALGLGARLPVLVPLSSYANVLAERDVRLDRFVSEYYDNQAMDLRVKEMLDGALDRGEALILLDGLDEVKEAGRRRLVVDRVVSFFTSAKRKGNKFVITSRIIGYREVRPVAEGLGECTLVDFDDEDIAQFVEKWTGALERAARGETALTAGEAARERRELLDAVRRNEGVKRLASNPLLLTILAVMKRQGVTLPERRVELYENYVKTLLRSWNLARGLDRPPTCEPGQPSTYTPSLELTLPILAPLALWMHETSPGVGLVKREAMRRELERICATCDPRDPAGAARRFLDDVHEHAGLLLERGEGTYGFIHLTFQEYLAAVGLAMKGQKDLAPLVDALAARVGDDNWHEVFLLTIGYLGIVQQRPEAAGEVLAQLIQRAPGEPGQAVVWAGESALDVRPGGVDAVCQEQAVRALRDTMCDDAKVKPVTRAAAGNVLAKLGDPRPGVVGLLPSEGKAAIPDMEFCLVPAGPFWMGSKEYEDEGPEHLNERLNYDYWIGRYPVTVAQLRCFHDDPEGWQNDAWWTEAGLDWRRRRVIVIQRGEPLTLPNHPAFEVSWYEAVAFTRWLTARWRSVETRYIASLPNGWEVRLPSESEWEKAARGGVAAPAAPVIARAGDPHPDLPPGGGRNENPNARRRYPWGDEPDPNRANCRDAGIGTTSAVGCFPGGVSPYGCEDMSGNVWEWCATKRQDSYAGYRDDNSLEGDRPRVLRGGAFINNEDDVRCAYRNDNTPSNIFVIDGFRVVVVVSPILLASEL